VEAARDLGLRVAHAGGYPVIPHTMTAEFDKQLTDEFWLDGTMALLKKCDAMVLTNNWEQSSGARAEQVWATENRMPWWVDGVVDTFYSLDRFIGEIRYYRIGAGLS